MKEPLKIDTPNITIDVYEYICHIGRPIYVRLKKFDKRDNKYGRIMFTQSMPNEHGERFNVIECPRGLVLLKDCYIIEIKDKFKISIIEKMLSEKGE